MDGRTDDTRRTPQYLISSPWPRPDKLKTKQFSQTASHDFVELYDISKLFIQVQNAEPIVLARFWEEA